MSRERRSSIPPKKAANPAKPMVIDDDDDVLSELPNVQAENKELNKKRRISDLNEEILESKKKKTNHVPLKSSSSLEVDADELAGEFKIESSSLKDNHKDKLPDKHHSDNSNDKQKHKSPNEQNGYSQSQELHKSKDTRHPEHSEDIKTEHTSLKNEKNEIIVATSLVTEKKTHEGKSRSNEANVMEACTEDENRQNSSPSNVRVRDFLVSEFVDSDISIMNILLLLLFFAFK